MKHILVTLGTGLAVTLLFPAIVLYVFGNFAVGIVAERLYNE